MTMDMIFYKVKDITGQKFGKLTAVKFENRTVRGQHQWLCKCDCGNIKIVRKHSLTSGTTISCGCLAGPLKIDMVREILVGKLREEGYKMREIGARFNISRQRVFQILQRSS